MSGVEFDQVSLSFFFVNVLSLVADKRGDETDGSWLYQENLFFLRERGIYLKVALELAKAADLRVIG